MIYIEKITDETDYSVSLRTDLSAKLIALGIDIKTFVPTTLGLVIERLGNSQPNVYDSEVKYETFDTTVTNTSDNVNYVKFIVTSFTNKFSDEVLIADMPLGQYRYTLRYVSFSPKFSAVIDEGLMTIAEEPGLVREGDVSPVSDIYK